MAQRGGRTCPGHPGERLLQPRGRPGSPRPHRGGEPIAQRRHASCSERRPSPPPTPPTGRPLAASPGPLHGVPFTVKENIDLTGSATTQGPRGHGRGRPAGRRAAHRPAQGGRRHSHRPHEPAGLRPPLAHRQRPSRRHKEPVGCEPHPRRLQRWRSSRPRHRYEPARRGERPRRLAALAEPVLRHGRDQADLRPRARRLLAHARGGTDHLPADGRPGPDGPPHRRPPPRSRCHVRPGCPRPLVDAGAAQRPRLPPARGPHRQPRRRRRRPGRRRGCAQGRESAPGRRLGGRGSRAARRARVPRHLAAAPDDRRWRRLPAHD